MRLRKTVSESSGLKIHKARMKCLEQKSEVHRGPEPGEMQEEPDQEATRRAKSLYVHSTRKLLMSRSDY